jgi:NADH-quinone oxidoreductase subunit E
MMTMPVFGMLNKRERDAEKLGRSNMDLPFDLPQEMAAAMRLMAQPAAGVVAMSAIGFGIASHGFGLWIGAMTGTAQAMQRLFAPLTPGERSPEQEAPVAPRREKPALKVVAQSEPVSSAPVVVEPEAPQPIGPAARAKAAAPKPPVALKTKVETIADTAEPMTRLQPEDFHRPRTMERPTAPDDLKAISGIGPKLEKVLNDLGVWTYAQIAAWRKQEVAWIDDYLSFRGRIDRDGWIEQARALASAAEKKGR